MLSDAANARSTLITTSLVSRVALLFYLVRPLCAIETIFAIWKKIPLFALINHTKSRAQIYVVDIIKRSFFKQYN